jgi:flagellar hook-length control protein FliK
VRDALDAALPRLRDMLESQGLQLVDVDVSGQDLPGRHQAQSDTIAGSGGVAGSDEDAAASLSAELLAPALRRGLVDEYA